MQSAHQAASSKTVHPSAFVDAATKWGPIFQRTHATKICTAEDAERLGASVRNQVVLATKVGPTFVRAGPYNEMEFARTATNMMSLCFNSQLDYDDSIHTWFCRRQCNGNKLDRPLYILKSWDATDMLNWTKTLDAAMPHDNLHGEFVLGKFTNASTAFVALCEGRQAWQAFGANVLSKLLTTDVLMVRAAVQEHLGQLLARGMSSRCFCVSLVSGPPGILQSLAAGHLCHRSSNSWGNRLASPAGFLPLTWYSNSKQIHSGPYKFHPTK